MTKEVKTKTNKIAKIVKHNSVQPETLLFQVDSKKHKANKRRNMHLEHKPSDEMDILITEINNSDLGWKADTCKY